LSSPAQAYSLSGSQHAACPAANPEQNPTAGLCGTELRLNCQMKDYMESVVQTTSAIVPGEEAWDGA
jgi:hypothetical protein